ncbi:MAG: hypothetical protein ACRDBQ_00730 [Shewanella sp.]
MSRSEKEAKKLSLSASTGLAMDALFVMTRWRFVMIDLDKLTEVMDEIIDSGGKESHLYVDEVLELITRLRQAEKDAARYRWLADRASTLEYGGFEYQFPNVCAIRYMEGAQLNQDMSVDEAVDEAMNGSNN